MGPASPSPTFDQDHSTDTPMTPSEEKAIEKETTVEDALAPPVLDSQDVAQTPQQRRKEWIQFAALCLAIYVAGWNDATVGPLLPRLQEVYHVGYAVVSLIFITGCIGFITGASSFLYANDRFGFGKIVVFGSLMAAIGFAIQSAGPPFPAYVISFVFSGLGEAYLDAGSNAYVAGLTGDSSIKMGIMHAIYGVGALCSPLVSTQFARLPRWNFVYLTHVGLVVLNALAGALVFRFRSEADCLREIGQAPPEKTKESAEGVSKYKQLFRLREVHLMAFFIFAYVGTEVTIGGWIVTYIINERGGGANSGYISSGYWGGITVGRIALIWFSNKLGEWRAMFVYIACVFGLELVVWRVPHLISSAVCISFVGFFLGPMYPIVMNHAGRVLPQELISGGIGWISSFGSVGSLVFPFITGAIASGTDIGNLQPLLISLMALLFLIWAFVPRTRRGQE